ncbi:MAG: orotidine-5'-phosphate decarboxylase [Candidatus Krumholzibacteriota bacterium]|nr:orotidine-5'-phosphate decarboxylase [Candidatus Krumholzibacteriota bacterium]
MAAKPEIIAALDVESRDDALSLVGSLRGTIGYFKVGSRLFTAEGPRMIDEINNMGASVFLDLKFHDIPATVAGAVKAACAIGVKMMTLHTCGGVDMMKAAADAAAETSAKTGLPRPLLVGVTVLTSMASQDLSAVSCYEGDVESLVLRRAGKALEAGLDGIVSSVHETEAIRKKFGDTPVIVTPGIRPVGSASGDQKRIATPAAARDAGSDYLVIGRPIYQAPYPVEAAEAILAELLEEQGPSYA